MTKLLEYRPERAPRMHEVSAEESKATPNVEELVSAARNFASAHPYQSSSPRSREIRIDNFRSDRYKLLSPLVAYLENQSDYFVAESFDTNQYGEGFSPEDAITMLCEMIEDYYELLIEDERILGRIPKGHLRYLRSILAER